jgi:hypothetical protein
MPTALETLRKASQLQSTLAVQDVQIISPPPNLWIITWSMRHNAGFVALPVVALEVARSNRYTRYGKPAKSRYLTHEEYEQNGWQYDNHDVDYGVVYLTEEHRLWGTCGNGDFAMSCSEDYEIHQFDSREEAEQYAVQLTMKLAAEWEEEEGKDEADLANHLPS